jgi:hypothetical protein
VIGELLNDRPPLASRKLAAHSALVRDRGVALVVGRVPGVDGDLQCSVTSGCVPRSAATSRSKRSRAAWRARIRTRTLSRSPRPLAMLRGTPCRACRRLRFLRDRIITPPLLTRNRFCIRLSTSAIHIGGHHVIAKSSRGPQARSGPLARQGRSEAEWLDRAEDCRTISHRDGRTRE